MELEVNGPKVYFELPFDLPDTAIFTMKNLITQTTVTLFITTVLLIIVSVFVTKKLTKRPGGLQVVAEKLVTMLYNLVEDTMGKHNLKFAPYIGNQNIEFLVEEIERAMMQIMQNGAPRIVFTHFALAVSKQINRLQ